jgi:hypothetical protein
MESLNVRTDDDEYYHVDQPPIRDRNQNWWCDCCLKHISELKPFGGPGDPLSEDYTGAYLVKRDRIGKSLECRDCIILSGQEYAKRAEKGYSDMIVEAFTHGG